MIYWDTSALIKLFVREPGTNFVRSLLDEDSGVIISKIGYVEAHSALARRMREGSISKKGYEDTVKRWNFSWKTYIVVELSDQVIRISERLLRYHPLRAFDAIHLGSALFFRESTGVNVTFVCSDQRLLESSKKEGLSVIDPLGHI